MKKIQEDIQKVSMASFLAGALFVNGGISNEDLLKNISEFERRYDVLICDRNTDDYEFNKRVDESFDILWKFAYINESGIFLNNNINGKNVDTSSILLALTDEKIREYFNIKQIPLNTTDSKEIIFNYIFGTKKKR